MASYYLLEIGDDLKCDGQTYKTNPQIHGNASWNPGYAEPLSFGHWRSDSTAHSSRSGFYITPGSQGEVYESAAVLNNYDAYHPDWRVPYITVTNYQGVLIDVDAISGNLVYEVPATFSTNLPIFESWEELQRYIEYGDNLPNAINYMGEEAPEGTDFLIENVGEPGTWTATGNLTHLPGLEWRAVRGRLTSGKMAFYEVPGQSDYGANKALWYKVVTNAEFVGLEYSVDNMNTWQSDSSFHFDRFFRKRDKEVGTFWYGTVFKCAPWPIFKTLKEAEDWVNDDPDKPPITDAENWDDIYPDYPDEIKPIEDPEEETVMGSVYTKSFFQQQYILSADGVNQIANALFDTSSQSPIWDQIKQGIEMYGNNPIDVIASLVFYPVDLTSVFAGHISPQNHIFFGGYQFNLINGETANKIIFPDGKKELGSIKINPGFGDYRDYEPYTRLRVYLPYIGWRQLDINKYVGKTCKVTYYFDTRNNGITTAVLFCDGIMTDFFQGQCGCSMPITLTDYSAYANTQINTLLGGVSGVSGSAMAGASSLLSGAGALGVATVGASALTSVGKTVYGIGQTNVNSFNRTVGGSTPMINEYLPQYVIFEYEIQELYDAGNPSQQSQKAQLYGYPSNRAGRLSEFSGYFEADMVELTCEGATDEEKDQIISLLKTGIRI